MADWVCPKCGGGFPEPKEVSKTDSENGNKYTVRMCPWCRQKVNMFNADKARVFSQ